MSNNANLELIERFYGAFAEGDGAAMAACYAPDIQASFRFRDGLIVEHRDRFSFHAWARQALGPTGLLLGWTPIVRNAVRKKAGARLDEYEAGRPG